MTYIGIDNGLDGGVVGLNESSTILFKHPMPVKKVGKGRQIDILALRDLIYFSIEDSKLTRYDDDEVRILIEHPSKHSPGVLALCSTWQSFGTCVSILTLSGHRWDSIIPSKWQKRFWVRPKMPKGTKFDTKAAALNAAQKLWPNAEWTKSERARKPHDGMIDAALIAEYARQIQM